MAATSCLAIRPMRAGSHRPSPDSTDDPRVMKLVGRASATGLTVTVAYSVAVALYAGVDALAHQPAGPMWDDEWVVPMRSILLMMVLALLLFPAMRTEGDSSFRNVCVISALVLAVYAALKTTGLADPDVPLPWVAHHILEPLRTLAASS